MRQMTLLPLTNPMPLFSFRPIDPSVRPDRSDGSRASYRLLRLRRTQPLTCGDLRWQHQVFTTEVLGVCLAAVLTQDASPHDRNWTPGCGASGGCDSTVKVWKLYNGSWRLDCLPALQMHKDWVRDVAWAPNLGLPKSTIASASQDGTAVIWTEAKEGEKWEGRVLQDFKTPVWRVSWSLTGNILADSDGNNNVTLWKEAVDGEWQQVTTVEP